MNLFTTRFASSLENTEVTEREIRTFFSVTSVFSSEQSERVVKYLLRLELRVCLVLMLNLTALGVRGQNESRAKGLVYPSSGGNPALKGRVFQKSTL
jgi:hypothetical protein